MIRKKHLLKWRNIILYGNNFCTGMISNFKRTEPQHWYCYFSTGGYLLQIGAFWRGPIQRWVQILCSLACTFLACSGPIKLRGQLEKGRNARKPYN